MFGKSAKPAAERASPPSGELSFIGGEVTITGNLGGGGHLHVEGEIIGDIACKSLILGTRGRVKGNIVSDDARLSGTVEGAVEVQALAIQASARITGDVSYQTVSVENGAQIAGQMKCLGQAPAELRLVAVE